MRDNSPWEEEPAKARDPVSASPSANDEADDEDDTWDEVDDPAEAVLPDDFDWDFDQDESESDYDDLFVPSDEGDEFED